MAKSTELNGVVEHSTEHHQPNVIDPNLSMMILTWVTFFLFFGVLYKFAWKPILEALDRREKDLKDAIDNADRLKNEMENLEATRAEVLAKAEAKGKEIVEEARRGAVEAAKVIQHKAKEEGKILIENATRQINEEKQKAQEDIRSHSAEIAIELAGKLIEENLDKEKNRKLVNRLIKDL